MVEEANPEKIVGRTVWSRFVYVIGGSFSLFQLTVPVFFYTLIYDLQLRAIHVLLGVATAFMILAPKEKIQAGRKPSFWVWLPITVAIVANVYVFINWKAIYLNPGYTTWKETVLGCLLVLVTLEAARRGTGLSMPITVISMFVYVFCGFLIPGDWGHPGFSFKFIMQEVYWTPVGMYGFITGCSATFIAVMIIFGSLLLRTGGGKTFMDLSLLLAGRFRGGPAKVAVVASTMFSMINGSPVANVAVTGNYTIPLMKRMGFNSNFAGGVEAMASSGGTITPPIMGITAFIMAELIGVPYIKVMYHALIPCVLYFIGVMAGVHFESLRLRLPPVPKDMIPSWRSVIRLSRMIPFILPPVILVWLLLIGFDLTLSGFAGCLAVMVFHTFSDFSLPGIKKRILEVGDALSEGGRSLAGLVPIMVLVSILINLLGITGIAPKISMLIMDIGGWFLVGALMAGATVPLVLGSALPTAPSYILAAALVGPALLNFKLELIAVHLFLLYWAGLSAVTPPTCVPAVIAANLGGGYWLSVAWVGMRLGIVAFLMPFFFVIEPALIGIGGTASIVIHALSASVGAVFLAASCFGYMRSPINIFLRGVYAVAGLMLLFPGRDLMWVGGGIAIVGLVWEAVSMKLAQRATSQE